MEMGLRVSSRAAMQSRIPLQRATRPAWSRRIYYAGVGSAAASWVLVPN